MSRKISGIYAKALFECQPKGGASLASELQGLCALFKEPQTRDFFLSPVVPLQDKKHILAEGLASCSPLIRNFIFVLLDKARLDLLPQIETAFKELREEHADIRSGTIYSPAPLSEEQKRALEAPLEKFFGKKLVLRVKEDKNLTGGVCVKAGGFVFDGSVALSLKNFQTSGG